VHGKEGTCISSKSFDKIGRGKYFVVSTNFICLYTEKSGFVTATKLGTTNIFFVAATKNFDAATKHFVDRTKHFVVRTKYFCYPYFNK